MALEEAISMEPVKIKLKNLKEYMKGEQRIIYEFASYLADRLNPELIPEGFNLACELVLEDLRRGGDYGEFGKVAVPSNLTRYPPALYSILRMSIPNIAKAVCPSDFAEKVKKAHEEINKKIRESFTSK